MKKLTKRVQAGGLWFDAPFDAEFIFILPNGEVCSSPDKPIPMERVDSTLNGWLSLSTDLIGLVDLRGDGTMRADWRECCWYVGDQVSGEESERREWMAQGAIMSSEQLADTAKSLSPRSSELIKSAARACFILASRIRSGAIDL
ncbi:MAG: hypothetical protein [Bacteriophage sp.]|nr:MAG: hypothetical protein [Bacteriophage sp.]